VGGIHFRPREAEWGAPHGGTPKYPFWYNLYNLTFVLRILFWRLMRWLLLLASVVHEVAPWGGQETVVKANDGRWTVWSVLSHPR
jgi:hypothetical protein